MKKLLTFIGVLFLLYWGICIFVDTVVVLRAGAVWTILSCVIGGIGLTCFVASFYPPLKKGALIGGILAFIGYILFHHFVPAVWKAHQLTDCSESGGQ